MQAQDAMGRALKMKSKASLLQSLLPQGETPDAYCHFPSESAEHTLLLQLLVSPPSMTD